MNKFARFGIFCGSAIVLATVFQASAQISGQGGPIRVKADRTEVLDTENKVILIDNVDVVQGNARLRADVVTLQYEPRKTENGDTTAATSGFGTIKTMHARGKVFYVTPDFKANGDNGVYNVQTGTITLVGNVVLVRGNDVATGERLVMHLQDGKTLLDGGENQVNMVFTVEE